MLLNSQQTTKDILPRDTVMFTCAMLIRFHSVGVHDIWLTCLRCEAVKGIFINIMSDTITLAIISPNSLWYQRII